MSYKVLSRKWRPKNYSQIVGQDPIVQTLINSIKLQRISHSYLFTGPRGVGKTTAARVLAKSLNCQDADNIEPCNQCTNCNEITNDRSLDVTELDGASNNTVNDVRDLKDSVRYPPQSSKYRIFIIDEVHMLSNSAFNALLKTLEEPPKYCIFILATTDPYKIPATIISRTQKLDFSIISQLDITNHLKNILINEKINFDDKSLEFISLKAEGSMRDALSILEQIINYCEKDIKADKIKDILGIIEDNEFYDILLGINQNNYKTIIDKIEQLHVSGFSYPNIISGFNSFISKCMLVSNEVKIDGLNDEIKIWLKSSSCIFNKIEFLKIVELGIECQMKMKNAIDLKVIIQSFFIKLANFKLDDNINIKADNNLNKDISKEKINKQNKNINIESSDKNDEINKLNEEKDLVITNIDNNKWLDF